MITIHLQMLLTDTWQRSSQHFLRPSSVHFSPCSTPPPDWHIDLLAVSTSHRCCETFTVCGLLDALISRRLHAHLLMPVWFGATLSFQLHSFNRRHLQSSSSSRLVIWRTRLSTADSNLHHLQSSSSSQLVILTAVHCCRSCISCVWKPPLQQSATRHHRNSSADCFS